MCKLTTDFEPVNCTSLEIGGTRGLMYGISYDAWLEATKTVDPLTGALSSITLTTTGAKAVKYSLTRGGNPTSVEAVVVNGGKSGFIHTVSPFLPTKEAALRQEIAGLLNFGRMVWIVVLDSSIVTQVFGNDVGLSVTGFTEVNNDQGKGGGFDVVFSTPADVTSENLPPVEFKSGDRATTLLALEALTTVVV